MDSVLSLQEMRFEPRIAYRNLAEIFVRQNGFVFDHGRLPLDLINERYGRALPTDTPAPRSPSP